MEVVQGLLPAEWRALERRAPPPLSLPLLLRPSSHPPSHSSPPPLHPRPHRHPQPTQPTHPPPSHWPGNYYRRIFCLIENQLPLFVDLLATSYLDPKGHVVEQHPAPLRHAHIQAFRNRIGAGLGHLAPDELDAMVAADGMGYVGAGHSAVCLHSRSSSPTLPASPSPRHIHRCPLTTTTLTSLPLPGTSSPPSAPKAPGRSPSRSCRRL